MTSDTDPKIKEALKDGRMTAPEITRKVFPDAKDWEYPHRRSHVVQRCLKLTKDGGLMKRTIDGTVYFELVVA